MEAAKGEDSGGGDAAEGLGDDGDHLVALGEGVGIVPSLGVDAAVAGGVVEGPGAAAGGPRRVRVMGGRRGRLDYALTESDGEVRTPPNKCTNGLISSCSLRWHQEPSCLELFRLSSDGVKIATLL